MCINRTIVYGDQITIHEKLGTNTSMNNSRKFLCVGAISVVGLFTLSGVFAHGMSAYDSQTKHGAMHHTDKYMDRISKKMSETLDLNAAQQQALTNVRTMMSVAHGDSHRSVMDVVKDDLMRHVFDPDTVNTAITTHHDAKRVQMQQVVAAFGDFYATLTDTQKEQIAGLINSHGKKRWHSKKMEHILH